MNGSEALGKINPSETGDDVLLEHVANNLYHAGSAAVNEFCGSDVFDRHTDGKDHRPIAPVELRTFNSSPISALLCVNARTMSCFAHSGRARLDDDRAAHGLFI